MNNINFLQIYNENSTLCNQIYTLITSICLSIKYKKNMIVISDFLKINSKFSPISDIFNLHDLNNFLKKYNILLLDHNYINFDILSIQYGDENDINDLTYHFMNSLNSKNNLFLSNKINFNLLVSKDSNIKTEKQVSIDVSQFKNTEKKLFISIKINDIYDYTFEFITKSGCLLSDVNINFKEKKFIQVNSWIILEEPQFKTIFNDIITNINFSDKINSQLFDFKDKILYKSSLENNPNEYFKDLLIDNSNIPLNIINFRMNDEDLKKLAIYNNIDFKTFKQMVIIKYLNEIENYVNKNILTIILTNDTNNFIIYFLEKNKYNFKIIDQYLENDSEKELIHFFDYHISLACNEVYIGNITSTLTSCVKQLIKNKKNILFNFELKELNNVIINENNEDEKNNIEQKNNNIEMNDSILIKNKLPTDFNVTIYKNLHDDLFNLKDEEAIAHYLKHGFNEKRNYKINNSLNIDYNKLPNDFKTSTYKKLNNDLIKLNNHDLIVHYLTNGIKEKREYKNNINNNINNNSNINNKNDYSKLPPDFNVSNYKKLNKDLIKLSDYQATIHYLSHGMKEKREYKINKNINHDNKKDYSNLPSDFNVSDYKKLNKDLINLSDHQAIIHFLNNGMKEKREYKININHDNPNIKNDYSNLPNNFNETVYKNLHEDLIFLTDIEAKDHYLNYGILENREYKVNIYSNDLPSDFNVLFYKNFNNDLFNLTNNELIIHYLTYGLKENRKYKF